MPEGDTIFRAATTLRRAMQGARLKAFRSSVLRQDLTGRTLDKIEARGKNLLIHFDDGRVLRTHMRMSGSWHLYRDGESWQRPARQARVELYADNGFVAVCFNAPVVELVSERELARSDVAGLGPDATTDAFDAAAARARLQALPELEVGDGLLRQSAVAGIGNVIKSELMFILRQDPFTPIAALPADRIDALVQEGHRLLVRNRDIGPRTTRESLDGGRYWVYGRSGFPCRVCGTLLEMRRQGAARRSTYFCPNCQRGP